jgi:preprotein translocase subunit YajC
VISFLITSLFTFFAFTSSAFAQAAGDAAAHPSLMEQLFPFVIIIVIFFFLVIRPAQRRQKTHQSFVSGLKRGDSVLTTGGILGTIEGLTEQFVTLEIADGVRVRVLRSQIASSVSDETVKK